MDFHNVEEKEEQDQRLSQKHIKTLGFLQEIVNENKALKNRITELEVIFSFLSYIPIDLSASIKI